MVFTLNTQTKRLVKKARDAEDVKEEDVLITNYVDVMVFNPLLNCIDHNVKSHGNGHLLAESRYRKLNQAKKKKKKKTPTEKALVTVKSRVPDRSLELLVFKNVSLSRLYR
ncbi:hypothetical protein EDC94DRAFT_611940 [Helicostylum pulchrum]|nr:hypothetical protein EDC94DRAFT_611940 [Helicostylum pulchrum]